MHGFNDSLQAIYGSFGIDVGAANGNSVWELPLPSRIVVGQDHVIKSIDYDIDYKKRPEPEATLAVLTG